MTIKVGDRIPNATLNVLKDGVQAISTDEIFKGKKVVLFSLPGAFTPTCSAKHLPGYVKKFAEFKRKGVDVGLPGGQRCVRHGRVGEGPARARRPDDARRRQRHFTKALGLEMDGTPFGLGMRGKRFALYAEDGVVKTLNIEAPGEFKVSDAKTMLEAVG